MEKRSTKLWSYSRPQEYLPTKCQTTNGRFHTTWNKYNGISSSRNKGGRLYSPRKMDKRYCVYNHSQFALKSHSSKTSPRIGQIYNTIHRKQNHFGHAKIINFGTKMKSSKNISHEGYLIYKEDEVGNAYQAEEKRRVARLFDMLYDTFSKQGNKPSQRIDLRVWDVLKRNGELLITTKSIGPVAGVEVGDRFDFRLQLVIMGIHSCAIRGIDYLQMPYGRLLATSIVATQGYFDEMVKQEEILYTGEGSTFEPKGKDAKDQELKRGNLALKNSMEAGSFVRVVRGIKCSGKKTTTFLYDGLYKVVDYYKERGSNGRIQLKFKLLRCLGQKNIEWQQYY